MESEPERANVMMLVNLRCPFAFQTTFRSEEEPRGFHNQPLVFDGKRDSNPKAKLMSTTRNRKEGDREDQT